MSVVFHYVPGSPFAWQVQLVLEHKRQPYTARALSLSLGDLRQPEFLAVNPRGAVPALSWGNLNLWETSAIVEFLEELKPSPSVFPEGLAQRAAARRIAAEVASYLYPVQRRLMDLTLFRGDGTTGEPAEVEASLKAVQAELDYFARLLQSEYLVGTLSVADFALYPFLALAQRLRSKQPQHGGPSLAEPLLALMQRVEALPYYPATYPQHWR